MKQPVCICTVDTFLCKTQRRQRNKSDDFLKEKTTEMPDEVISIRDECESSQQGKYPNKRNKSQKEEYYEGFQISKLLCFRKNKESRKI